MLADLLATPAVPLAIAAIAVALIAVGVVLFAGERRPAGLLLVLCGAVLATAFHLDGTNLTDVTVALPEWIH